MHCRILNVRSLSSADAELWQDLAGRASEPNPFFEPSCVVPAARYLPFGHEIRIAVAEMDGRFHAAVPFMNAVRWGDVPYAFATTAIRRVIDCGTPLVDADHAREAMQAILQGLSERRSLWAGRILIAREMAEGGTAEDALIRAAQLEGLQLTRHQSFERPFLNRRDDEGYGRLHSGKHLSHLRRLRRRLEVELGGPVHLVDRSSDPTLVDDLLRMEMTGYKRRAGISMADTPGEVEQFVDMCSRFRRLERLHALSLQPVDGPAVAVIFLVEGGGGLFLSKVAFDERYSAFSPGIQLHLAVVEHFHERLDLAWIDACTYEGNRTLLRMYPDRVRYCSYLVPLSDRFLDTAMVRSFASAHAARERLHGLRARAGELGKSVGTSRSELLTLRSVSPRLGGSSQKAW